MTNGRKRKQKSGSFTRPAVDKQTAAMESDDVVHARKTKVCRVCGWKRSAVVALENLVQLIRRKAGAEVGNFERDLSLPAPQELNNDSSSGFRGTNRVGKQAVEN